LTPIFDLEDVMRTVVLVLAAIGTLVEAITFAAVLYLIGVTIGAYSMSMGGMPAEHGKIALWVLGGVLAVLLTVVAVLLVVAAVRRRRFGRLSRTLIVSALVLHAIIGLVVMLTAPGLVLLGVLFVFSCLLLALLTEPAPRRLQARHAAG
jgi:hypothetical protein